MLKKIKWGEMGRHLFIYLARMGININKRDGIRMEVTCSGLISLSFLPMHESTTLHESKLGFKLLSWSLILN